MNYTTRGLTFCKLKYLSTIFQRKFSCLKRNIHPVSASKKVAQFQFSNNIFIRGNEPGIKFYSTAVAAESPFTDVDVEGIAKGDQELMKKLNVIILEVEVMRQEGLKVPSNITAEKWSELLQLPTRSQRIKLLAFWWLNELKKMKDKKKKEELRAKRKVILDEMDEKKNTDHIVYGFGGCTMFIRIYDTKIDHFHNYGLIRSMLFGQNLVIDCSYDEHMNSKEASLCAKQLLILFGDNRLHQDPFNIHFCNVHKEGHVFTKLHKSIPTMYDDAFPMNIHENSYLSLFPKDRLVYLTPHCKEELREFNHDDIYIVGAMVDKVNVDPLSLGKAKSLGLRMAKLPLDRHLEWGMGTKSLTINQMLLILLELKSSQDWKKALQHVPKRKLKNDLESYGTYTRKFRKDLRFH